MPIFAFLGLAAGSAALSRRASKPKTAATAAPKLDAKTTDRPIDLIAIEPLELQVGAGLLPMIDLAKGGELPQRITALRRQVAGDLGLILPAVHLRDNLSLEPSQYRLLLRGLELGRGTAMLDRLLALDPRGDMPTIDGVVGKDPAFGLPAKWIKKADRPRAEAMGLTLVDPASVVTTHVSELVRRNASELLGRQELQELLAICAKEAPKLVEDTVPGALTPAELLRVSRGLLREGLSIRDLRTILEAMADAAPRNKDPAFLLDQARRRLARQITSRVSDPAGTVHALTLERGTEDTLRASLAQTEGEAILNPDIETARKLIKVLETRAANLALNGRPTVVITPPDLRRPIFDFASRFVPDLWVVSARELLPGTAIQTAGTLQLASAL
jgi:flagellar biosynthesis protein FlhA